jgi:predicted DNA-binding transcriptional regulator AlpA
MQERRLLREASLPRYALRRDEAATSISISPSLFDQWIQLGLIPKGRKIRGVVLWDAEELRQAWHTMRDNADAPQENPFDGVTA